MGRMKEYLLENQREEEEMMESYLEWVMENQDLFQQLQVEIENE